MNPVSSTLSPKGLSRREQILKKAAAEFAVRGYHATSVADILDGLEIARGTFYQYFENKKSIFEEILCTLLKTIEAQIRIVDFQDSKCTPIWQLKQNIERILQVIFADRTMAKVLLMSDACLDMDFDKKMKDFYRNLNGLVIRSMERGRKMGLVREIALEPAADFILGGLKEIVGRAVDKNHSAQDPASISTQIMDYIAHGFLSQRFHDPTQMFGLRGR